MEGCSFVWIPPILCSGPLSVQASSYPFTERITPGGGGGGVNN